MHAPNLGDILIFKADDKWISKLIAWGTFSDVSHAAMIYADGQMVEMGLDGIMDCKIRLGGGAASETAYQMRLTPARDAAPLIRAANRYLDAKIRYDIPALVLLGIALIYRHLHPSTRVYHLLEQLLTLACMEIDKLIAELLGHPDAMVCSQFVYQVYQDCGDAYQINIHDGVLQAQASGAADGVRLMDFIPQAGAFTLAPLAAGNINVETLCHELYDAVYEAQAARETLPPPCTLTSTARGLHERMTDLAKAAGIPLEALRVMPADLAYHADNLQRVSEIEVERLERVR